MILNEKDFLAEIDGDADDNGREEARAWLRGMLGEILEIKISDGRIIRGEFMCTDNAKNIILNVSKEFKPNDIQFLNPKMIGMVMIPGEHIVHIKLKITKDNFESKYYS